MNYGLYLSAAGAIGAMHRQNVLANNLANVRTAGFKPDEVFLRERLPARIEAPVPGAEAHLLERLGGGVFAEPTGTRFKPGAIERTGNPLDVALTGSGFFMVRSSGAKGGEAIRYSRDGRFAINSKGELVQAASGMRILDDRQRPIRLDSAAGVRIAPDGVISQGGAAVARIGVAEVADQHQLRKQGDNLFHDEGGAGAVRIAAEARLEVGAIEASAVDPVLELKSLIDAGRAAEANFRMIQYHDTLNDQVINRVARVA